MSGCDGLIDCVPVTAGRFYGRRCDEGVGLHALSLTRISSSVVVSEMVSSFPQDVFRLFISHTHAHPSRTPFLIRKHEGKRYGNDKLSRR